MCKEIDANSKFGSQKTSKFRIAELSLIAVKRTRILNVMETTEDFEVMIEDSFQRLEEVVSSNALERISSLEYKLDKMEQELVNFLETVPSETKTD